MLRFSIRFLFIINMKRNLFITMCLASFAHAELGDPMLTEVLDGSGDAGLVQVRDPKKYSEGIATAGEQNPITYVVKGNVAWAPTKDEKGNAKIKIDYRSHRLLWTHEEVIFQGEGEKQEGNLTISGYQGKVFVRQHDQYADSYPKYLIANDQTAPGYKYDGSGVAGITFKNLGKLYVMDNKSLHYLFFSEEIRKGTGSKGISFENIGEVKFSGNNCTYGQYTSDIDNGGLDPGERRNGM